MYSARRWPVSAGRLLSCKTDGALGAARGAGYGAGIFQSLEEAFSNLELKKKIEPAEGPYKEAYAAWKKHLESII